MRYRAGYKYQLAEDYAVVVSLRPREQIDTEFITLTPLGSLRLRRGYAWDGPSGPTIDTKNFMRGSLVHDALYQIMRKGWLDPQHWRKAADEELRRICREDGMSRLRAWVVYRAVRIWAGRAASEDSIKQVHVAP